MSKPSPGKGSYITFDIFNNMNFFDATMKTNEKQLQITHDNRNYPDRGLN